MKFKVVVSYDGSNFHGWARQTNAITIQQVIEETLFKIFNKNIKIECSGRTDAYVHAIEQVFTFEVNNNLSKINFVKAMNDLLPKSIRILSIKNADDKFNARFNAKQKTYLYVINTGKFDIFKNNYLYNYNKPLNLTSIKKTSKLFIGTHNFLSFSTSTLSNTTRTISKISISKNKNLINIKITGNGFLRNQVRMIVGSLIDVSENKKDINSIKNLLINPKKGSSITKVPGCGLYLLKVKYKK